jgi:succinyl-diaminopimelate desuccinylase
MAMLSAVDLLAELVRIDTQNPPGQETVLAERMREFLVPEGVEATVEEVGTGRANLFASVGAGRPHLLLLGHADTVPVGTLPWRRGPFAATVEDGRLYGRGAADMKGALAAMATALVAMSRERLPGRVSLLVTAGEEVDSLGARAFVERHGVDEVDGVVIGEPTGGRLAHGHKGALWAEVTTYGRTAHGAMPEAGVNAVEALLQAAAWAAEARQALSPRTTVALTRIWGGVQTNVIPDEAGFALDIRSPDDGGRAFWARLTARLAEEAARDPEFRWQGRILSERSPLRTPEDAALVQVAAEVLGVAPAELATMPYYTDGSVLTAARRIPAVLYGPGEPAEAHRPDESVSLAAVMESVEVYQGIARRFLEREGGAG